MSNNSPSIDELRDSFNRVYDGPDRLRREYDLQKEARQIGIPLDDYRRLYELRGEEEIDPYPRYKNWWRAPGDWGKWVWYLPRKKKLALARKGVIKLIQSGVILTIAIGVGRYVWEAPDREKQRHYQAWQIINLAAGQRTSGGRIEALQDLNNDKVSLAGLDVKGANLQSINLHSSKLLNVDLTSANLEEANLSNAFLIKANLSNADLFQTDFSNAYIGSVNFSNANLFKANFSGANLDCYFLNDKTYCTSFKGAMNITPAQIKQAKNWQGACYDPKFRKELGLPPKNPKYCAGEQP